MKISYLTPIIIIATLSCWTGDASAAQICDKLPWDTCAKPKGPGSLDTRFGAEGKGVVFLDAGGNDEARAMAVRQTDGKVILAGVSDGDKVALARFCPGGLTDDGVNCGPPGFGDKGVVITKIEREERISVHGPLGFNDDYPQKLRAAGWANAVTIQKDGKIVIAGGYKETIAAGAVEFPDNRYRTGFLLVRYCPDGQIDDGTHCGGPGFGKNGITMTVRDHYKFWMDVEVDIINRRIRSYTAKEEVDRPDNLVEAHSVIILDDGRVVVGGDAYPEGVDANTYQGEVPLDCALARYCPDGKLDEGQCGSGLMFGDRGIAIDKCPGGIDEPRHTALALYRDEDLGETKILTASHNSKGPSGLYVASYCSNGYLDNGSQKQLCGANGFGGQKDGVAWAWFEGNARHPQGLMIQKDGKPVALGTYVGPTSHEFALARFCPDGLLDDGNHCGQPFGANGEVHTRFAGQNYVTGVSLTLQDDDRIVAVGFIPRFAGLSKIIMARYCKDGQPDEGHCQRIAEEGFGKKGQVVADLADLDVTDIHAAAVAIDTSDSCKGILVAGTADSNFLLARFLSISEGKCLGEEKKIDKKRPTPDILRDRPLVTPPPRPFLKGPIMESTKPILPRKK